MSSAAATSFVAHSYDPFAVVPPPTRSDDDGTDTPPAPAPHALSLGVVAGAQGSAYIEWHDGTAKGTKLVAAVFGPRDRPGRTAPAAGGGAPGSLCVHVRHAPFANKGRRTLFGSTSRPARLAEDAAGTSAFVTEDTQQAFLSEALAPFVDTAAFPKLTVDIAITVVESAAAGGVALGDGELEGGVGALADTPALTAACAAALVDAGVPMRDMPSCALVAGTEAGALVPDPTPVALQRAHAVAALVYSPRLERVAHLHTLGRWRLDASKPSLHSAIEAGIGECARTDVAMRAAVSAALRPRLMSGSQ